MVDVQPIVNKTGQEKAQDDIRQSFVSVESFYFLFFINFVIESIETFEFGIISYICVCSQRDSTKSSLHVTSNISGKKETSIFESIHRHFSRLVSNNI